MKHKQLFTAGAFLAAFAVAVLVAITNYCTYLLISNEQTAEILFVAEISDGEIFSVSYIHSVNNSPVTEYYQIRDTEIYLTALRFSAFGAGMPTKPEEGQTMRLDDGDIVIEGFERPITNLCYFIGRTASHTMEWRGGAVPLDGLDEPGQPVLFSVAAYPRIMLLFKEVSSEWNRTD